MTHEFQDACDPDDASAPFTSDMASARPNTTLHAFLAAGGKLTEYPRPNSSNLHPVFADIIAGWNTSNPTKETP